MWTTDTEVIPFVQQHVSHVDMAPYIRTHPRSPIDKHAACKHIYSLIEMEWKVKARFDGTENRWKNHHTQPPPACKQFMILTSQQFSTAWNMAMQMVVRASLYNAHEKSAQNQ